MRRVVFLAAISLAAHACKKVPIYDETPRCASLCPDGTNVISGSTTTLNVDRGQFQFSDGTCETVCEPIELCLAPNVPRIIPDPSTGAPRYFCEPLEGFSNFEQDAVTDLSFGADYSPPPPETLTLTVGDGPRHIAAGDVDGDGRLDLVTGNTGSADLSILLATSAGAFSTAGTYALPGTPFGVALADLNADGRADLLVAVGAGTPSSPFTLAKALANGAGGFGALVTFDSTTTQSAPSRPVKLLVGTFDAGAHPDLVVANYPSEGGAMVFLGDGLGGFASARNMSASECVGGLVPGCHTLSLTDFNADGLTDLLVVPRDNPAQVAHFANRGGGVWTYNGYFDNGAAAIDGAVMLDVNGEGSAEVALVSGGAALVILNAAINGTTAALTPAQACGQTSAVSSEVVKVGTDAVARSAPDCSAIVFWSFDALPTAHALLRATPAPPAAIVAGPFLGGSTVYVAATLPSRDEVILVRR